LVEQDKTIRPAISFQFSEIAHLRPPNCDDVVLKKQRVGIASRTTMYSPNFGFGHIGGLLRVLQSLASMNPKIVVAQILSLWNEAKLEAEK
jgi:hypothetical protein